jgi:hypothetical protein
MTTSRSRIVAGVLIATGGFVVAVTALAIALAKLMVDAGIPARPADAALLDDLFQVLPFIVGFALVSLLAAIGLFGERAWGATIATGAAVIAVVVGIVGLTLVVVGNDPFATTGASRAREGDGIGILFAFTGLFAAVLVALFVDRLPAGRRSSAAA